MKNFFILLLIVVYPKFLYSQTIDWKNFSCGIILEKEITNKDLNKYWGNSFGVGIISNYLLEDNFSLEGAIIFSKFKSKNQYPNFTLIKIPFGIKYNFPINKNLNGNFFAGLQNNTFSFDEKKAEQASGNLTESEMGVFISIGAEAIIKRTKLEVFCQAENLFTFPENLQTINLGIKVFYF